MQVKVMLARFPYGAAEQPDVEDWLVNTVVKAKADDRVSAVLHWRIDETPITLGRNRCLVQAKQAGADLVVMVDSDMKPDAYLSGNIHALGSDPLARPFWDSSFDFWWQHHRNQPCVIAAPYQGPPPYENCYQFRWANRQSDHPGPDYHLDQISREDAARMAGIEEIAALPTGLVLIDLRCLDYIKPPYFEYEYADPPYNTKKATTEDVFFTRNLSLAGVPVYINWDAWAGHWKRKCVGKPHLLSVDAIRASMHEAILRNAPANERRVMINEGNGQAERLLSTELSLGAR